MAADTDRNMHIWIENVNTALAGYRYQIEALERDFKMLKAYLQIQYRDVPAKRVIEPVGGPEKRANE